MLGTGMPHSGVMTKNSGNTGFSSAQSRLTGLTGAATARQPGWLV